MGRKSKLTPPVHDAIIDALERGAYAVTACNAAGVDESTMYRWLARGETSEENLEHPPLRDDHTTVTAWRTACAEWVDQLRADEPYRVFRQSFTRASARAELIAVTALEQALKEAVAPVTLKSGDRDGFEERVEFYVDHGARVKAAVEFLKRRHPARWTDGKRLEHAGTIVAAGLDLSSLSPEQLEAVEQVLVDLPDEVTL